MESEEWTWPHKSLILKSTKFPHYNIHKYTFDFCWEEDMNHTDHDLIYKRRNTNIVGVRYFRGADIDTGHYLVDGKVRLLVSKWVA
jgi:hypothetical protein